MILILEEFKQSVLDYMVFVIVMLNHTFFAEDVGGKFEFSDTLIVASGLWITIFLYRLICLQLPISWYMKYYLKQKAKLNRVTNSLTSGVTFVLVFIVGAFFIEVISEFTQSELVHIPVIALFGVLIASILTYSKISKRES